MMTSDEALFLWPEDITLMRCQGDTVKNIAMTISYDGTAYHGFQVQPNVITIQQVIEEGLQRLTRESIVVTASGRTDTGVHARGQVIQFQTNSSIPVQNWARALNSVLPDDIVALRAIEVPDDFHAIKSAIKKTYRFSILNRQTADVFLRNYAVHVPKTLDWEQMKDALSHFIGTHNFTSFCSPHTQVLSRVRTIFKADITKDPSHPGLYHIWITGSGFLYNMVRIIAGTLLQVGSGKQQASSIPDMIRAEDRSAAGPTAPAKGLCLWEVKYAIDC